MAIVSDETVTQVLVLFKCHLDVGFTDTEAHVVRTYFEHHIPLAIETADRMRADGDDRFVWTIPAWMLYRYLEQADSDVRRKADGAISQGDLAWHALPFTWYTELLDRSSVAAALGFSASLDARFGTTTTAARLTDVPGHTRGLVGPLADAGITFLDVGVNAGCQAPDVPWVADVGLPESEADVPDPDHVVASIGEPVHHDQNTPEAELWRLNTEGANSARTYLFRWQEDTGKAVNVLYHPLAYGSTVRLPKVPVALSMHVHGDNLGPHSVESIRHTFASLRAKFPRADVRAANLSQMGAVVDSISDRAPVCDREIGDSWIYGTGSDPAKTADLREVLRLRREWVADGRLIAGGEDDLRLLARLVPAPEHNWGLNTSVYLRSWNSYRTAELADALRDDPRYAYLEQEWLEKRRCSTNALTALPDSLRAQGVARLAALREPAPELSTKPASALDNGVITLEVSPATGAISSLIDLRSGRQWAGPGGLALMRYEGYSVADYRRFNAAYNHSSFAANDFGKPGLVDYPADHVLWAPRNAALCQLGDGAVLAEVQAPSEAADDTSGLTAWPGRIALRYALSPDEPVVEITCWVCSKPANRRPEALWLSFFTNSPEAHGWRLDKLGQYIDPDTVIANGGRRLHGVEVGAHYRDRDGGLDLETMDAHLVSPGERGLLEFDNTPLDRCMAMHIPLYNNLWGTAFPQWYQADMRFRLRLRLNSADQVVPW